MTRGAALLVVGVDGLDYDVVRQLGPEELPNLHDLVATSEPHASTFPPDSVPSWTSILTGVPPEEHGQLHSVNFLLGEKAIEPAGVEHLRDRCFWEPLRDRRVAIINPFLAHPPWAPSEKGAMVSGPSFAEEAPAVADPSGLLTGPPPNRMGGFARIPAQREIEAFVGETLEVAQSQFDYTLRQLEARRWDLLFHTNLTVDRVQHFAWRHFDATDPTHPGSGAHRDLVPRAHRQLDDFIAAARSLCGPDDRVVVVSDHGHGQRASIGVNLNEAFRREGLFLLEHTTAWRRALETAKTVGMWAATSCHLEAPAIWVARRLPGKSALKSGAVAGRPSTAGASVPNVGGSNPFGGIRAPDPNVRKAARELLTELEYRGTKILRWCAEAEEVLETGCNEHNAYPDLLFELDPRFGPTWNMYGPLFAPIITHKRLSGGHTRRGVVASDRPFASPPRTSTEIHAALLQACREL